MASSAYTAPGGGTLVAVSSDVAVGLPPDTKTTCLVEGRISVAMVSGLARGVLLTACV